MWGVILGGQAEVWTYNGTEAQICPFVCLKGSTIDGPGFWGMVLTSAADTCINHRPASFSASLLVTFVSPSLSLSLSLRIKGGGCVVSVWDTRRPSGDVNNARLINGIRYNEIRNKLERVAERSEVFSGIYKVKSHVVKCIYMLIGDFLL